MSDSTVGRAAGSNAADEAADARGTGTGTGTGTVAADVVVIGAGMAGCTAALAAARADSTAAVRVVSAAESTFGDASGLIDVLGYKPNGAGPIKDPFTSIPDMPPEHPYSILGVDAVREGLALFDDVAGAAYRGGHTDLNAMVPTAGGAAKPTARYPKAVTAGLAARTDEMLLVGFDRLTAMDAHLVADLLAAGSVPFGTMGVDVRFPVEVEDVPAAPVMAAALDENEPVGGTDYVGHETAGTVRSALADAVYEYHGFQPRIGLPGVLGVREHAAVGQTIEDRLDAEVFEVPLGPPSVLGHRLERLLFDALERHGVALDRGAPVVDVTADGDTVDSVLVADGDDRATYRADEFVLATGGLVSEGIETDRVAVREALFDCHVRAPPDRDEWYDDRVFGDHAFPRFGVSVDESLRPLTAAGDPEYRNLRAAGAVVGGYDMAAEKSGSGVSLATGRVAGTRAAESL
jgi:glycerol-3-phosphate dehydrogenase subunit B